MVVVDDNENQMIVEVYMLVDCQLELCDLELDFDQVVKIGDQVVVVQIVLDDLVCQIELEDDLLLFDLFDDE